MPRCFLGPRGDNGKLSRKLARERKYSSERVESKAPKWFSISWISKQHHAQSVIIGHLLQLGFVELWKVLEKTCFDDFLVFLSKCQKKLSFNQRHSPQMLPIDSTSYKRYARKTWLSTSPGDLDSLNFFRNLIKFHQTQFKINSAHDYGKYLRAIALREFRII